MRANRTDGSEGGEGQLFPTPIGSVGRKTLDCGLRGNDGSFATAVTHFGNPRKGKPRRSRPPPDERPSVVGQSIVTMTMA